LVKDLVYETRELVDIERLEQRGRLQEASILRGNDEPRHEQHVGSRPSGQRRLTSK
jgi:hypothetical protein